MGVRKVLSLTALLAGVYLIGRTAAPDLGEVIDYVNAHPQHQEIVLNRTMYNRDTRKLGYSAETLGNFSRALLYEFSKEKAPGETPSSSPRVQSSERGFENTINTINTDNKSADLKSIAQVKKFIYDLVLENSLENE